MHRAKLCCAVLSGKDIFRFRVAVLSKGLEAHVHDLALTLSGRL